MLSKAEKIFSSIVLIILYFILSFGTLQIGDYYFTATAFPLIMATICFGPSYGIFVGIFGELLNQIFVNGIVATLPLWLIPPIFRCLILAIPVKIYQNIRDKKIDIHFYSIIAAAITTITTSIIMGIDATYFGFFSWSYITNYIYIGGAFEVISSIIFTAVSYPVALYFRENY